MELLLILENSITYNGIQAAKFHNQILIEAIQKHLKMENQRIVGIDLEFLKTICHLVREMESEETAKNVEFTILFMEDRINFPQFCNLIGENVAEAEKSAITDSKNFFLYLLEEE